MSKYYVHLCCSSYRPYTGKFEKPMASDQSYLHHDLYCFHCKADVALIIHVHTKNLWKIPKDIKNTVKHDVKY